MFAMLDGVVLNRGARREYGDDGREYIVAPVSLIVPGVLSGSKGALYYPPEEVARSAPAWDGMPLTVGHPTVAGRPVSAKHPGVSHVGTVRNPGVRNGSLRAEGWFDVGALRLEDPTLLRRLERGDRIEVSTGLFTANEPAPAGSSHNGRAYEFVARHYRPDHLAILPDEQGACSLRDGCGVNNRSLPPDPEATMNSLSEAERADVMPALNCRCDEPDMDRGAEPVKKVGTFDRADFIANEDELNALLFGGTWGQGAP